jgi:hypothetical protein
MISISISLLFVVLYRNENFFVLLELNFLIKLYEEYMKIDCVWDLDEFVILIDDR